MRLCSIASGSSGNCIYVGSEEAHVLVDVGISGKNIEKGLNTLDLTGKDVDGILITHEHSDHIKGLGVISRKYGIPIYATGGTADAMLRMKSLGKMPEGLIHEIREDEPFEIKDLTVNPFTISHDAAQPVGYRLKCGEHSVGIATDLGKYNDYIVKNDVKTLIMIQEAFHEKQIAEMAGAIAASPEKKIVLIAGPSSSGKTTFSHRLSTQLAVYGLHPHPIAADDYFVNREKTPKDEDGNYDFERIEAIDTKQLNADMSALLRGETVELPSFNFKTGKREYKGRFKKLEKNDILIIEGIHGLNDQLTYALPRESKFRIYISALTQLNIDEHNRIPTTDGRLLRRIVRDARTRGTSARATIAMWDSVRRGEENHIFPYQENADVMFNSALIYELAVLKQYAEPLLFSIEPGEPEYEEAKRLLKFLDYFLPIPGDAIPNNSLIREFIGGGCFDL